MKLLFDCDGTILDSMKMWVEPINSIFEKYGYSFEGLPREEKGKIEALPFGKMIAYIAENIAKDMTIEEINAYFSEIVENAYKNTLMPKNGVLEKLKTLHEAGYQMAIASSTDSLYLDMAFKRLNIDGFFSFYATPDLTNQNKSDPEFWQYAIKRFNIPANEIILYDDALYAIKAAKKEGIKTCGVKDFPYNEREWDEIEKEADLTLENIAHIDIDNL